MELPLKERLHWLAASKEQLENDKERFIHKIGGLYGNNGTLLNGKKLCSNNHVH